MQGPKQTKLCPIIFLLACFSRAVLSSSGFCAFYYSDQLNGTVSDHYFFYAFLEGIGDSLYHVPSSGATQLCRSGIIKPLQEIGEGSLIAPSRVNACESVCNLLLQDVRTRESRSSCKYNEAASKKAICEDRITPDRLILRPHPATDTGNSFTRNQPGPPEMASNGTSNTGSEDERFGPGADGSDGTEFSETPLFFGPNNSTTSSECDLGFKTTYKEGDSFCRGTCTNLVEQVLIRLSAGSPALLLSPNVHLVSLWVHIDVWDCP